MVGVIIGIDPGGSGGISFITPSGTYCYKMPETERDVYDLLDQWKDQHPSVFLERVHSMPGQGVSSVFTFGRGYGFLRGVITALKYPLHDVIPQRWQKALGCLTKGDKNVSKQKAQQLFPQLTVTHNTADSLLIAEYGRLIVLGQIEYQDPPVVKKKKRKRKTSTQEIPEDILYPIATKRFHRTNTKA